MQNRPETIDIPISGDQQELIDILQAQFSSLEAGELRSALERNFNDVWTAEEFEKQFDLQSCEPPYAYATRRADQKPGVAMFTDEPRFYFAFISTES